MKTLLLAFVVTQMGIDLIVYGWLSTFESRLYTLEDEDYNFRNTVLNMVDELRKMIMSLSASGRRN